MDALIEERGSVTAVVNFKNDYHNVALAEIMLKKNSVDQFIYNGNKYIRKKHPAYKEPGGEWGRAHFYAPAKSLGDIKISTPVFNLIVIWFSIGLLYVALYADLLRRIIRYFETFRLRRLHRRLQKLGA
jgi:hypothetical protein